MNARLPDPVPEGLSPLDEARIDAVRAEVCALAQAAAAGSLDEESLAASLEALRQIPLDPVRVLDAVHVPDDAGEHREGLERVLRRIPDGWGRWISCGPGWYSIVVRLADEIAELLPEYEIHQVKEKYGTLRFYWGTPHREPVCCESFTLHDPRPSKGAISGPFAPKDRDPEEQRLLEEWFLRSQAHLESQEHKQTREATVAAVDHRRAREIGEKVEALVDAAEEASARTCERCGSPGSLHENAGWLGTLCARCAEVSGYVPCAPY